MDAEPILLIRGLQKSYGSVQALRGVNLAVSEGEIYGFLGPNGAGKTTTIRCLLDLIRPDAGQLRVAGIDPQKDPVGVRAICGYLPGELSLESSLSAEQLLRHFIALRGSHTDWGYVQELAHRLDLNLKRKIKTFSKGNKQKVGLLQALMHRPKILILDEPTAGLDPLMQQETLRLIGEARREGATVFFSSHILSEVRTIADRVCIIRQGRIVEVVEPDALIKRSLRRIRISFRTPVDSVILQSLKGVKIISQNADGTEFYLQAAGEMADLIKTVASQAVIDFDTERPTLEEVFLEYYKTGDGE